MNHSISLAFEVRSQNATQPQTLVLTDAVIAGWTGRDRKAMEKHIAELEALGVARPVVTPTFYRTAVARVTLASEIEVSGTESSGEVEFVLIQHDNALWVGAGSDHTDRAVETYSVTVSKQMCDKPVAPVLWPYHEVSPHWDELVLRAYVIEAGERQLYQEGLVSAMLAPDTLIDRYTDGAGTLADGTVMFGGTLTARGGVRPASRFEFQLEDPVLRRDIVHGYDVMPLPVNG